MPVMPAAWPRRERAASLIAAETNRSFVSRALALLLVLALPGCADVEPEVALPGVHTASTVTDSFRCGELLVPEGCPIVRFPTSDSGCVPELPGHVVCTALVNWTVVSGAAAPGSRLVVAVNGTESASCDVEPQGTCTLAGNATYRHGFDHPGQRAGWTLAVDARLEAPGAPATATGEFTLTLTLDFRTGAADAASA